MPAFMAQGGMPYWIDLITSDVDKAAAFYEKVLGWETETTANGYRLARAGGLPVAGFISQPKDAPAGATWVTHFLADDIDATCEAITAHGGTVSTPPTEVQLGRMALILDPGEGFFGLIEPHSEEAFVAGGEPATCVWHELTCTKDLPGISEFYRTIFDWTTNDVDAGDGFSYVTALADGAPFAGMWTGAKFPEGLPNYWQSYIGVKDIDATATTVEEEGGKILRQPWDSEFGRLMLIEDPTGGAVTLCEVDEPVEEGHEGDPLEGIDLSDLGMN